MRPAPAGPLKITTPSDREILITRGFGAPRALVWKAMTTPELIRRWLFAPPGWVMTACLEDVSVGGAYRWAWNGPDGSEAMAIRGIYREVVPVERLVRTEVFEFGGHPQEGEQLCTMLFAETAPKATTIAISVLYPSKEARDAMLATPMEQGLAAGYNALEALLGTM